MIRSSRAVRFQLTIAAIIGLVGCKKEDRPTPADPKGRSAAAEATSPARDEIPSDRLAAVIAAHYRGLGAMERYEYPEATRAFGEVNTLAPGWTIGTLNLAIALLNQGGEAAEKSKKLNQANEAEATSNIERAKQLLDGIIAKQPDEPHARFSRGIILYSQGDLDGAHRDFDRVTKIDPHDPHAWLEFGSTIVNPDRPWLPAGRPQAPELISAYTKALEANPYLVPAMYRLMLAYGMANDPKSRARLQASWEQLDPKKNPAAAGQIGAVVYGEMGKYAEVINPFPRPRRVRDSPAPKFGAAEPIVVALAPGDRWAAAGDYAGAHAAIGRARQRFGAGVASFDFNRDGLADLYMTAAVVGPLGLRDVLLVNLGDGRFADATAAAGLPLDRAGLGVAPGDFDADRQVDLYLTGLGDNRLLRLESGKYVDVTRAAGVAVPEAISLTARWFDLDQDGDLDLYVINHAQLADAEQAFRAGTAGAGPRNSAFRNDGKPAPLPMTPDNNLAPVATASPSLPATAGLSISFSTAWPGIEALRGAPGRHTAFAALDIDEDRDFDYVIAGDGEAPTVIFNDRAGRFHSAPLGDWTSAEPVAGLLVADVDRDGRADLVATSAQGRVFAWRNETSRRARGDGTAGASYPINARFWRSATTADLDLDTWADLVGLPAGAQTPAVEWAQNQADRFEQRLVPIGPSGGESRPSDGFVLANLIGDALPDLLICADGAAPRLARNLGNGSHWLAVDLAGRWKNDFDLMRTNSAGLGTRLTLEGGGLYVPVDSSSVDAGTASSLGPLVLGLGPHLMAPLLRLRWPDGVMQAELNVPGDKLLKLAEFNRKTGSCPILFTWNGAKFVCIGDFAGAAGLGFLEAPGVYHPPDRDEALAIGGDQLAPRDGLFQMSIVEPMDEVAYLDELALEVVDHPPGIASAPDERFSFGDPQPSGALQAWRRVIVPRTARDHRGRDVLSLLANADRQTVDQFARIQGRIGYTDDHAVTLDFGDVGSQLDGGEEPVLCLAGWVEYPYSQTNYAAATGGLLAKPPTLEQKLPGGGWQILDSQMGHPAGLSRLMTYRLAGKLLPGASCELRIATNMECYWDQAFIAVVDRQATASLRTTRLVVAGADLRDRGYLRESSPDGLMPLLPDHAHVDPAPLARFGGMLTRHGDVAALLRSDDDQLCVMGPGDEVRLEFDGRQLPPLEPGWRRSYVLRAVAYCKDADPFTATSDSVEPLPWRGMPPFPFAADEARPADPAYSTYLRTYQTRPAGMR